MTRHQAIYQRLSLLDRRYTNHGIAADRRRALWAALDEDPLFQEILKDRTVDVRVREGLSADLTECRRIRAVMEEQGDEWCASSIYEALIAILFFLPSGDDFVFRGHLDDQWRLIPSFFRMQPRISLMLYARTVYGAYRWAERAVGEPLSLTPFEAEAAAQHYGAGTTLLDVTESLRVAAYFATTPLRETEKRAERGAIYVLSVADLAGAGRSVLRGRALPASLTRIHRTSGAFVSGLGYSEGDTRPIVRSASDITQWINASAHQITRLDEMGLGVERALADHRLSESAVIRFTQIGESFVDEAWGVSREQLGYREGIRSTETHVLIHRSETYLPQK